ncbi:MAG: hypothetical protein M3Y37_04600, partial [Chloroflexota bacterium]|nr:hypothetical protein [Chloroflexota bacterium]
MSRLLIVLLVLLTPGAVRAQNDTILSEKALEAGLQIQQVATDLPFPMGMVALDDGSILVATSPSESGNFYDSTGQILHLADSDGDGTFETVTAVATDLPGSLVALARHEDIVITTSAQGGDESLTFFRMSDDPNEPLVELDRMHFNFQGAIHQSYGLAVRNTPGEGDSFDVFFNIGAAGNDTAGSNVRASGPVSASLEPATIYMVTISDEDGVLEFTEPVLVATGLRNASALLFHPETGDLLIGENGIDGIENPIVSYSADELNVVEADAIGVEVIDFGFPDAYVDYATGEAVGDESDAVAFLPLEGDESEG